MPPDPPDPAAPEGPIQISANDARQGERRGMIYILGGGLALAILLIGIILMLSAA